MCERVLIIVGGAQGKVKSLGGKMFAAIRI